MDNLFLYTYLFSVILIVLIDKLVSDFRKAVKRDPGRLVDDVGNLGNYTFNFENQPGYLQGSDIEKDVSGFTKLLVLSLIVLIVFIPLYKMVVTLEPVTRYFFMNCLS